MGRKKTGAVVYPVRNHPTMNFMVSLRYPNGKRLREYFKDEADAETRAGALNKDLLYEGLEGVRFGAEARAEYAACKRKLDGRGVSLMAVVDDWLARLPIQRKKTFSKRYTIIATRSGKGTGVRQRLPVASAG
ncbi:hypothetical protein [Cerasicoccus maritimus]|uniref:hypothetical protein n=1 Tax=Cerasicoccus maritimus TaxID=490089 RepID=UPI0028527677|nr:hypothetical protein [Cerasicoccus maritimus]